MMEMATNHNSIAVKRGHVIFVIFLMSHDRNFIMYLSSTVTVWPVALTHSPYIRAIMRSSVFLSRPGAGQVPVSRNG